FRDLGMLALPWLSCSSMFLFLTSFCLRIHCGLLEGEKIFMYLNGADTHLIAITCTYQICTCMYVSFISIMLYIEQYMFYLLYETLIFL
ncbi:hypothetical protein ACJX0J_022400, partial [Zea mays]